MRCSTAAGLVGSTSEEPSDSLPRLVGQGAKATTTSRRRSATPATAIAIVVLVLSFAVPASAGGGPGDAGSSGDAGTTGSLVVAQPVGALPGIDVSHHQGLIDWSQVAGSGQRFAFAKAT